MDKLKIRESLYKQFLAGKYCDLHIQVENSYFKAHSCIVAAASWVLEAILQSSAAEDPNLSKLSIQLHGVTAYALSSLLCFIYTDKFPAEVYNDVEKRNHVLQAAKLYKMDEVLREFTDPQSSNTSVMSNLEMLESGNLNDSLLENFTGNDDSGKNEEVVLTSVVENEGHDDDQINFIINEDPPAEQSQDNLVEAKDDKGKKLSDETVKEHVLQNVDYAKTHGILYCVICSKICETKADLISHMNEHKTTKVRQRPERAAAIKAGAVASLLVGVSNDDDEENIDDFNDDSMYLDDSPKAQKRKRGRPKRSFACGVCGIAYNAKGPLVRHYNNQHPETLFCKFCTEHFETAVQLHTHIATHPEAAEGISSTKPLDADAKKYRGKKVYTCNLCSTSFMKKKELTGHQAKLHGIVKPMHICTICGREFKERSSLKAHNRVHTGEKPYMCSFCGNSFADQKTWKDHERRHRGEKPFLCTTCGKSFTYRQSFTRHMKFHEGKRPFQCSICGKAFVLRQNLKEHEKRHNKK